MNHLTEDFIDSCVDSKGLYMDNSGKYSGKYWQLLPLTAAIVNNILHLSFAFSKKYSIMILTVALGAFVIKTKGAEASIVLKLIVSLGFSDK